LVGFRSVGGAWGAEGGEGPGVGETDWAEGGGGVLFE
jgi:hypothetical protein